MLRKYWRKLLAPVIITIIAVAVLILMAIVYFGLGTVMLAFGGPVWLGGCACLVWWAAALALMCCGSVLKK